MTEKKTRGRPRRAEADEEILEAALALLREGGYRALSLDEVARRAGTAKSSIYRRWPSKAALAAEIIRREVPPPADGVDPDEAAYLFADLLNGPFGGVAASLIGEGQESEDTRAIMVALIDPYRRGLAEGEPAGLLGSILFQRLLG